MNLNNLTSGFSSETPSSSSKNVLANDVDIKGTIRFENELIFDGKLEGEIASEAGALTLGKNADVHGEVKTKSVVVHGNVTGNITVSERCELKASSQLTGDLKAMRIIIEEGATFIGKSEVAPNKPAAKSERAVTPATPKSHPASTAA
ncbi:MAG: polymer-forming cytoskeletal protein [Verrucomicrobiota bacterium]